MVKFCDIKPKFQKFNQEMHMIDDELDIDDFDDDQIMQIEHDDEEEEAEKDTSEDD